MALRQAKKMALIVAAKFEILTATDALFRTLSYEVFNQHGAKERDNNEWSYEGINAANGADEKTDTLANKCNKRSPKQKN